MDFEDLMCKMMDEIEHTGIYNIAKRYGKEVMPDKTDRCSALIREDLTEEFHGCFPYYDGEDETPCYLVGCDYGCEHCPMKNPFAGSGEYNPESERIEDMVKALIKAIKMDDYYEANESEIETAIEIIRR